MMYMLNIISAWLFYFTTPVVHDAPVAMFRLSQAIDHTEVHITIDIDDFHLTDIDNNTLVDSIQIINYLNNNLEIYFDSNPTFITYKSINSKLDHYHIIAIIESSIELINEVKINNNCLLSIDNQSNIIQLKYNNKLRDFRMGSDRKELLIKL